MSSNSQFWLGVLLSVPVGILTSLATPSIQRWLASKSTERQLAQVKDAEIEAGAVAFYKANPEFFTQFLVQVAIKTTFIGAFLGVLGGLFLVAGQLMGAMRLAFTLQEPLFVVGQVAALMGSLMILNTCTPALRLWRRVRGREVPGVSS